MDWTFSSEITFGTNIEGRHFKIQHRWKCELFQFWHLYHFPCALSAFSFRQVRIPKFLFGQLSAETFFRSKINIWWKIFGRKKWERKVRRTKISEKKFFPKIYFCRKKCFAGKNVFLSENLFFFRKNFLIEKIFGRKNFWQETFLV